MSTNSYMVFSGTNSRYLAEKICAELNCPLGKMTTTTFADGEFEVCYEESIRGRDVFLVQSTFPSSDNLMELLLMIDAAKRASAHHICAVIPYFGASNFITSAFVLVASITFNPLNFPLPNMLTFAIPFSSKIIVHLL